MTLLYSNTDFFLILSYSYFTILKFYFINSFLSCRFLGVGVGIHQGDDVFRVTLQEVHLDFYLDIEPRKKIPGQIKTYLVF